MARAADDGDLTEPRAVQSTAGFYVDARSVYKEYILLTSQSRKLEKQNRNKVGLRHIPDQAVSRICAFKHRRHPVPQLASLTCTL